MVAVVFRKMSAGVRPGILAMPVNIVGRSSVVFIDKENPENSFLPIFFLNHSYFLFYSVKSFGP